MVHVHQRSPHRLARSGHRGALVRLPVAVCRATVTGSVSGPARARARAVSARDGRQWGPVPGRSDRGRARLCIGAGRVRAPSRRSASCSTTAPAARRRARRSRRSSSRSRGSRCRGRARCRGTWGRLGRCGWTPPGRAASTCSRGLLTLGPRTDFTGNTGAGGLWGTSPNYHWTQNPAGTALSYVTAPLDEQRGRRRRGRAPCLDRGLDARRRSPGHGLRGPARRQRDVRAERLAGRERAQARAAESTLLEPAAERAQGRRGAAAEGAVHRGDRAALRRGPRVPGRIANPDHDLGPRWRSAARGRSPIWRRKRPRDRDAWPTPQAMPSRIVLPVVPGVAVPTGLPPCPGLRGEPCRRYVPLVNRAVG